MSSRAIGHCSKFGYTYCTLRATASDLVIRYGHCAVGGRTVKICDDFCAMGHSAGFGHAVWAIVQGLVIRYGP
jgi:hypothetical protein